MAALIKNRTNRKPDPGWFRFQPSTQGERGAMLAVDLSLLYLTAKGVSTGGAAGIENSRTATMVNEMTQGTVNEVARSTAKTASGGAGAAGRVPGGPMVTATSGHGFKQHPRVQALLDSAPYPRPGYHGACCEPKIVSTILNSGRSLRGFQWNVFSRSRGTSMPPCTSCRHVFTNLGLMGSGAAKGR